MSYENFNRHKILSDRDITMNIRLKTLFRFLLLLCYSIVISGLIMRCGAVTQPPYYLSLNKSLYFLLNFDGTLQLTSK